MSKAYSKAAAGTFALNKIEPIHRWYSYLEGYSSCLIEDLILEAGPDNIHSVYDPFCGTGTTCLVAAKHGIESYYSETNPFMRMVIESKINCIKRLRDTGTKSKYLKALLRILQNHSCSESNSDLHWDGFEKYFDQEVLCEVKYLQSEIEQITDQASRKIALVILASVLVRASKMIRQGDLRFAKDNEKALADKAIVRNYIEKLENAISDIDGDDYPVLARTSCLAEDCRDISAENIVDCVITSPPYLNGTNYVRNTKLELKLAGFVTTEKDLPSFHSKGIIAGINNVSRRKEAFEAPECVNTYIVALQRCSHHGRL